MNNAPPKSHVLYYRDMLNQASLCGVRYHPIATHVNIKRARMFCLERKLDELVTCRICRDIVRDLVIGNDS